MSTVDLPLERSTGRAARPAPGALRRGLAGEGAAGRLLGVAVLLLTLYAVFDHGAVATDAGARVDVALAILAALAAAGLLWTHRLRVSLSRGARAGLLALAGLVAWSGISLAWSVAPDATWLELNRDLGYLIVLGLGVVVGASGRDAPERLVSGLLWVTGVVALYALAQKLLPEVRVGSLLNLDRAGAIPRLQEPLGYWNALGVFVALGIPAALLRTADAGRRPHSRTGHLTLSSLMLVTVFFTLSRGALLALVVALAIALPLAGPWLRGILWLAVSALSAAPAVVLGLADHALSGTGVPLASRAGAGALLLGVLLVSLAAMAAGARYLMGVEAERPLTPAAMRRIRLALAGVVALAAAVALAALVASSRGPAGEISHIWGSFTTTHAANVYDPQHLLSDDSENRWVWWKEAAGAFSARPLLGWGAGSFAVVDRLYRRDLLTVAHPHSLPLQFLTDTGLVGGLLALAAFVLLLLAATRRVRAIPAGPARLAAAALLAGVIAWLTQSLYDWDWDIPAVTLPALLLLGVLVASPAPVEAGSRLWRPPARPRPAALLMSALACALIALSAALPSLAAGEASSALVLAGGGSRLAVAESAAELAGRLDPLTDAGLKVQATVAIHQGDLPLARRELQMAVVREPSDVQAWQELAGVELLLDDVSAAVSAADRALALDPVDFSLYSGAFQTAQIRSLLLTPPADSATAIAIPAAAPALPPPTPPPSRAASAYSRVTLPPTRAATTRRTQMSPAPAAAVIEPSPATSTPSRSSAPTTKTRSTTPGSSSRTSTTSPRRTTTTSSSTPSGSTSTATATMPTTVTVTTPTGTTPPPR